MGISPESSEEEIVEFFTTCKVSICVVENLHQFDKIYEVSAHTHMHIGERERAREGEGGRDCPI